MKPELRNELNAVLLPSIYTEARAVSNGNHDEAHLAGLLAVYNRGLRDGAMAQREMEPTWEMRRSGAETLKGPMFYVANDEAVRRAEYAVQDIYRAMQRAAPLATEKGK